MDLSRNMRGGCGLKKLLRIGASDVFIWIWKSKLDFQNALELVD